MKSTVLKKKDSTLTKKYLGLFALLFVISLAVFFDHFLEAPVTVDELQPTAPTVEAKNEVGFIAPDFVARDLKGNRVSLSDYKGQVVVLNMWATWCAPCRVEMPGMENMYRRFRTEGLVLLAVSIDKGKDQQVAEFVEEYKLTFPVLLDPEQDVEKKYSSFTIPTTYVIDKQGRIAAKVDGAKNWESEETFEALEFLLKKA